MEELLPVPPLPWKEAVQQWADAHSVLLGGLFVGSLVMLVGTAVAVPFLVVRIPTGYFSGRHRPPRQPRKRSVWWLLGMVGKNLLGVILVVAGVAMLVLPGQGLLTILLALVLLDFPGKFPLQRWVVRRTGVLASINWIRRRAGYPALEVPEKETD